MEPPGPGGVRGRHAPPRAGPVPRPGDRRGPEAGGRRATDDPASRPGPRHIDREAPAPGGHGPSRPDAVDVRRGDVHDVTARGAATNECTAPTIASAVTG